MQNTEPSRFESLLASVGVISTREQIKGRRIEAQKKAIRYWEGRVEARKTEWDRHLQSAFDRNLGEINKAVNQYTKVLQDDPQDKIYNENAGFGA